MRRKLLYGLLALVVLLAVGYVAAKSYLSSRVTPAVAARLETALGMPVEVAGADVGLQGGSELRDVRVYEPAPPAGSPSAGTASAGTPRPPERPWFRVERVEADVSVLDVLRGAATPRDVRLSGVSVLLRFDKNGNLLTHLPTSHPVKGALPELTIEGGTLTIDQEGRAPVVVGGVRGSLKPAGRDWKIAGTVADPHWGAWDVGGAADTADGRLSLTLDCPKADLTPEKLNRLPFVSPAVWRQVTAEGSTPVRLTLDLARGAGANHCKVELAPTDARLFVTSIDLKTEHAGGKLVVEDDRVTLSNWTGQAAGGTIGVNGFLDFRPAVPVINLDVTARDVAVQDLPRSWDLPRALDGRLTGTARLRLRLTEPTVDTDGSSGQGVVTGVTVLGLGKGEARLYLHPGPGRFRFRQEPPGHATAAPLLSGVVTLLAAPPDPPARPLPDVGTALDWLSRGLGEATSAVGGGAAGVIRRLRDLDQPPPPGKPAQYFEANLSLQDVDLGELVRRAKLVLPFPVAGKLSFDLHVGFPVDRPRDFLSYRFQGNARLPSLDVAGFAMADVRARVRYSDGVLSLESLQAKTPAPGAPAGSLDGTARYQLVPPGELSASLRLEQVPLGVALRLLPGATGGSGAVSGTVEFRADGGRLSDPEAWQAGAILRSERVSAYGVALRNLSATLAVTRGTLAVRELKGNLEGAAVSGTGKLRLAGDYPLDAVLSAPGLDLSFARRLVPEFRPPVSVTGRLDLDTSVKGTLRPLRVNASGTARGSDLAVGAARIGSLGFRYALEPGRVRVSDLKADVYRGTVTGSATLPLGPAEAGEASLRINGVDAGALARDVPALPVRLNGKVSGTVTVKLPAAAGGRPRETTASVELTAPDLQVQGIPTQHLRCTVSYRAGGGGSYRLECDVAGGTMKLEGPLAPRQAGPGAPPAPQGAAGDLRSGTLRLRGVHLGRLLSLRARGFGPLGATLSVDLPFRLEGPDRLPAGRGTFTLTGVRWGDAPVTDRVQGEVRLGPDGVTLGDVSATVGGGDVRLRAGYRFARGGQTYLNVELWHVEAAALLAPFPALAGFAEGPADLSLRLSGGRELRGDGRAVLARGRVLGVEVADWRVPFDVSFMPGVGGQLDVRDGSARIARGQALGRASLSWGDAVRLGGSVRFFDADLGTLVGRESAAAGYAAGKLTGTLDFASDNFRSAADLTANLAATLSQAQASSVPVVQQVVPFVGLLGIGGSTRFENGELRGRLAGGVFRVQRFTLSSGVVRLILEGDVTLAGRLDLELTAATGNYGVNSRVFQLLGLRLPALGPLPLALVVDASAFLANRVVHLRVTGNVSNPVVRVEPTGLFSQEAVRYFLSRTALPVTP